MLKKKREMKFNMRPHLVEFTDILVKKIQKEEPDCQQSISMFF